MEKTQILNVLRNLTTPVALYGEFDTIWWKKNDIQTSEQPMLARLVRAQLANIGLKNAPVWEEDFAFHIFNMAQNNKYILAYGVHLSRYHTKYTQ